MLYERYVRRLDREAREKGLTEGLTKGRAEMLTQLLDLLDEDTRKDVERKLRPNGDSDTQD